jgi:hypothetical protein
MDEMCNSLQNHVIRNRLSFLGAEPVAFADEETGKISEETPIVS